MSGLCTIGRDPDRHVVVVNVSNHSDPYNMGLLFLSGRILTFFTPSTYVKHLNPIGCFTERRKKHLLMPLLAI
jgi:hypothetical protein